MASKSHYWFKSYGDFAEWMDFAYWWGFNSGGSAINGATPSSLSRCRGCHHSFKTSKQNKGSSRNAPKMGIEAY